MMKRIYGIAILLTFIFLFLDSIQAQQLPGGGYGERMIWNPVHDIIAYSNTFQIYLYNSNFEPISGMPLDLLESDNTIVNLFNMEWSPDGTKLATTFLRRNTETSGMEDLAKLWSIDVAYQLTEIATIERVVGNSPIAWSPDSSTVAFDYRNSQNQHQVNLYNTLNGNLQTELILPNPYPVRELIWYDNEHLLVGLKEAPYELDIWNITLQQKVDTFAPTMHPYYISLSPDRTRIAFANGNNESDYDDIQVWQISPPQHIVTLQGHTGFIQDIAWGVTGIVSRSSEDELKLWNDNNWTEVNSFSLFAPEDIQWNPDGTQILIQSACSCFLIANPATGEIISSIGQWYEIKSIKLIDNNTGDDLAELQDNDIVDLADFQSGDITIKAEASHLSSHVEFTINGIYSIDDSEPYVIGTWQALPGNYELTVMPVSQNSLSYPNGLAKSINFEIVDSSSANCDYDIAAGDEAALIQAINDAKANPGAAVICLANSTYTFTSVAEWSQGPNALPNITDEITIIGNGATLTRDSSLSDARVARVARVASGGTLTVENVIFDDWDTYDNGGVFYVEGTLSLTDCTLRNSSGEQGGALYSTAGATLNIAGSTFDSNSTSYERGGAIYNRGSLDIPK